MYACVCYISFFYVSCVVFFDFLRVLFVPLAFAHLTLLRRERACARHHFPKEHTVPYLSDTHSHTHTPPPPQKRITFECKHLLVRSVLVHVARAKRWKRFPFSIFWTVSLPVSMCLSIFPPNASCVVRFMLLFFLFARSSSLDSSFPLR